MHIFLALDLKPAPLDRDPDEEIQVVKTPLPENKEDLPHLVGGDVKTIAGLALAAEALYS
jgi:hypothetical protein